MSEIERELRAAGAVLVRNGQRHKLYQLGERRISLHHGTRQPHQGVARAIRSLIRKHQAGG